MCCGGGGGWVYAGVQCACVTPQTEWNLWAQTWHGSKGVESKLCSTLSSACHEECGSYEAFRFGPHLILSGSVCVPYMPLPSLKWLELCMTASVVGAS